MTEQIQRSAQVPEHLSGQRLDKVVAEVFDEFSRSRLQQWIKQGHLTVDGQSYRGRDKVYSQQHLDLQAELDEQGDWQAEPIALDIIYEDDSLLVLNKPVGLVVHPGAGNAEGTLVNALLHHAASLSQLPRAGIVHRLDKDTSGLMVVAKTLSAHHQLVAQLQQRLAGRDLTLVLEPGRSIAANAGVLLTRVDYLKTGDEKNFAIVDAAMNDMIRPALYQAWLNIDPVRPHSGNTQTWDIVGPVCETGDFLGKDRELALEPGDLLCVGSSGAYGFTMSSNYNSRGRAAEIMVDDDQAYCVRERETFADLIRGESLLPD